MFDISCSTFHLYWAYGVHGSHPQSSEVGFCNEWNTSSPNTRMASWLSGNGIAHINKVTLHRARLVLGWVTMSGFNSRYWTYILVCDQPPWSTQPGHPFAGRRNKYQPKGRDDALRLGSKGRYGSCVGGRETVWSRCYTRATSEHFRDKKAYNNVLYKLIWLLLPR